MSNKRETDWGFVFQMVAVVAAIGVPVGLAGYWFGSAASGQWWGGAIGAAIALGWLVIALENS